MVGSSDGDSGRDTNLVVAMSTPVNVKVNLTVHETRRQNTWSAERPMKRWIKVGASAIALPSRVVGGPGQSRRRLFAVLPPLQPAPRVLALR